MPQKFVQEKNEDTHQSTNYFQLEFRNLKVKFIKLESNPHWPWKWDESKFEISEKNKVTYTL